MGMTIDKSIEILYERDKCMEYVTDNDSEAFEMAVDTMRKYQMMQADYENRLKADMVAMLTDIQLEIQEYSGCSCSCSDGIVDDIDDVIQQKIDALRGKA